VFEVRMPQLGETVSTGTVNAWLKSVGDTVRADEPLLEVGTDKVDTEVEAQADGTLLEIKVGEGVEVPVGTVIAIIGSSAPEDSRAG
jgi:2-oxoglutarate dehydrogenase E2 component (dihydrolipoamide succinyltransferase)